MAQSMNIAYCARWGKKHTRPVKIQCRRDLNTSAPVTLDTQTSQELAALVLDNDGATGGSPRGNVNVNHAEAEKDPDAEMASKLDLILRKMSEIEEKNNRLEKRPDEQHNSMKVRLGLTQSRTNVVKAVGEHQSRNAKAGHKSSCHQTTHRTT